jgi:hypothetical protein
MLKSLGRWTYIVTLSICIVLSIYITYLFFGIALPGEDIISMIPSPPDTTLNDRSSSVKPCGLVTARADYTSSQPMEEIVEFYRRYARNSGWHEFNLGGSDDLRLIQSEEWDRSTSHIVAAWLIPTSGERYIRIGLVQGEIITSNTTKAKITYSILLDYVERYYTCQPPSQRRPS